MCLRQPINIVGDATDLARVPGGTLIAPQPPLLVTGLFLCRSGLSAVDVRQLSVVKLVFVETDAYIALGSNLGDRELNLLMAVAELGKLPGCRMTALSRFYKTSPVDMPPETPAFYNAVARLTTSLDPGALLGELQRVERERFERLPGSRKLSRRMDLDLLLYGDQRIDKPDLTVPHPRMSGRRFVLQPLAEIAPDLVVPVSGKTVAELLAGLESQEQVRLVKE